MNQSHEQMIREFARMVGNNRPTGTAKWKTIAKTVGVRIGQLAAAAVFAAFVGMLGWLFLITLNDLGLIGFRVSVVQALALVSAPLLAFLTVPVTLHVKLMQ